MIFIYELYSTALHIAAQQGNLEIVKILFENEKIDANAKSILD